MIIEANTSPDPVAMCAHVFADNPNQYSDGCMEPEDPHTEPLASADEWFGAENLKPLALSPQLRNDFAQGLDSGLGASISVSSSPDASTQDKKWCYSYWERAIYCAYFSNDKNYAVGMDHRLFNVDESDSTKGNAFRHALWLSAMINSDTPDIAALKFAMNHESGQAHANERRARYKSHMDSLNNFTSWVYTAYSDVSDREACEHWVSKIGPARVIDYNVNPYAWASGPPLSTRLWSIGENSKAASACIS